MEIKIGKRIKRAYNAFMNRDPTNYRDLGPSYSYRPDRPRLTRGRDRSIVNSIYNRIALDVASVTFQHCMVDSDGRFLNEVKDDLNRCLNLEANIDQTGTSFIQDLVMSMFDEGSVAALPVEFDYQNSDDGKNLETNISSMRTGRIVAWYPKDVRIDAYDERLGIHQEITVSKRNVGIVENPFYSVMNEPNSTAQKLMHKLSLLDAVDDDTASGKMDLVIQLPYTIKGQTRKNLANERRKEIETQLVGSKYGIAYIDGTERVVQLNRSLENNLLSHIEYLQNLLFSQLNITQGVLDGTADEKTMLNYYNRTVEPCVKAIVDEFKRKFIDEKALEKGHSIMAFRDPFKLTPVSDLAEIADKFTRNEIMTSNEIRQEIGIRPSKDPKADELRNSNISQSKNGEDPVRTPTKSEPETNKEEIQNG